MPSLQFKGKTAVETYHYSVPHHTLEFDQSLSVLPQNEAPSLDGNLIIEGDNLLALKALLPTHAGRIKCIYIDPPYNTGNEGWVYNDNLTQPQFKEWIGQVVGKEGEDASRHDKWCCMMYPRLQLLKELLHDEGAIFVSLDDNEIGHLRLLMDEIFGEENFVACVAWQKKVSPANDAKWFSGDHEYVVVYAKSKDIWHPNRLIRNEQQEAYYKNSDNDPRGPWNSVVYTCNKSKQQRPNLYYPVVNPNTGEEVWPKETAVWKYSQDVYEQHLKDGMLYWGADGNAKSPRYKKFLSVAGDIVPRSVWLYSDVGHTQEASGDLAELFPEGGFDTPKPTRLIKRILQIATDADSLVLDSFAGSGTTAQAVLELNQEDAGNRKFVLVQQKYDSKDDEKKKLNICRTITAERVRRVITGQGVPATGGTFTYTKVSDSPLFGEYRDMGDNPPSYEELAKYVFYTETSRQWDAAGMERSSGKIGEHAGASYYLLYTPNGEEDAALDLKWLKQVALADPNAKLVVYCEKFWMHRDQLRHWEADNHKSVRAMIVPFNLK